MRNSISLWSLTLRVILLALTLSGCGNTAERDRPTTLPVQSPTVSEAEGGAGPQLLLADDFSDNRSGWLEADEAESSQGYRTDRFFFEVKAPDLLVWDNPGVNFRDFALEIEALQMAGAPENSYGVLFRYLDEGNFYRFDLTGDGRYAVFKLENEEWITLMDWVESTAIKPQGEVNLVRVICQGPRMTFYSNGQELTSVKDDSFERGDVGLFGSTFTEPNIVVEFDNLHVWEVE